MKSSAVRKDESSYSLGESGEPVVSDQLEVRVARIESDVEHIKTHTADISAELRRTNDRIDVTNKRIDEARESLTAKIDKRIDDLTGKYDSLKDLIHSSRVWALLLYMTLAGGLLTLIARAFKWI